MNTLIKTNIIASLLFVTSCTSENIAPNSQTEENKTEHYTSFISGIAPSRTSLDYNDIKYFWENGDKIYVKDDNGIWQSAATTGNRIPYYSFKVPGSFNASSYFVFYPGKNGVNDNVTISTTQTQAIPNSTIHIGESGDCGLATAHENGRGYPFSLDHKAAFLVFQPYTNDVALKDLLIEKIEIISDNNIAGSYTLDPASNKLIGTGTSKTITLKTGTGSFNKGFPMQMTTKNLSTNGAYMVIAPGHHKLQVNYWLQTKSYEHYSRKVTRGYITQYIPDFNYEENNYYDIPADLPITNYPYNIYYRWGAKQEYGYGHRDETGKFKGYGHHPISKTSDPDRWEDDVTPAYSDPTGNAPAVTVTNSAAGCPNANEIAWYVLHGDPYFDDTVLWTSQGLTVSGGMWFKKKTNIPGFSTEVAPDGTNLVRTIRDNYNLPYSVTTKTGRPKNIDDYFFLPAFGYYTPTNSKIVTIGTYGLYWSSTPKFNFHFLRNTIYFYNMSNDVGVYWSSNNEDQFRPRGL